jgi:hypothetical protein
MYVCEVCGSTDVEVKVWVKPNEELAGEVIGSMEDLELFGGWCKECSEINDIKIKGVDEDETNSRCTS